jgi:hypothetical protein
MQATGRHPWACLALYALVGLGAGIYGWVKSGAGLLLWDGSALHWAAMSPDSLIDLDVMLDLQTLVIVRLTRQYSNLDFCRAHRKIRAAGRLAQCDGALRFLIADQAPWRFGGAGLVSLANH